MQPVLHRKRRVAPGSALPATAHESIRSVSSDPSARCQRPGPRRAPRAPMPAAVPRPAAVAQPHRSPPLQSLSWRLSQPAGRPLLAHIWHFRTGGINAAGGSAGGAGVTLLIGGPHEAVGDDRAGLARRLRRDARARSGSPGSARGVQHDIAPDMLSLRDPLEVNVLGDRAQTLRTLRPMQDRKTERPWREHTAPDPILGDSRS
jgi:hypothetical protein